MNSNPLFAGEGAALATAAAAFLGEGKTAGAIAAAMKPEPLNAVTEAFRRAAGLRIECTALDVEEALAPFIATTSLALVDGIYTAT